MQNVTQQSMVGKSGSNLHRLSWGLNCADGMAELLNSKKDVVQLQYLNLRRAKITSTEIGKLSMIVKETETCDGLETLVLDGIKLSGCSALNELLGGKLIKYQCTETFCTI